MSSAVDWLGAASGGCAPPRGFDDSGAGERGRVKEERELAFQEHSKEGSIAPVSGKALKIIGDEPTVERRESARRRIAQVGVASVGACVCCFLIVVDPFEARAGARFGSFLCILPGFLANPFVEAMLGYPE
jgi:hypothetical protein